MYEQPQWGTVNLGVDVLQGHGEQSQPGIRDFHKNHPNSKGKQQYNPGRNQELNLPADIFPMHNFHRENPENQNTGKSVPVANIHERIKELLGEGWPRASAISKAKEEAEKANHGDVGTITPKDVYRSKYQAETPSKKVSPFTEQIQGYPFI